MPVYKIQPQLSGSAPTPAGSTKKAVAYIDDGYPFALTFECDDTSVQTYADLLNYLKTKGYSGINTENYRFPTLICSCSGEPYSGNVINNIYVGIVWDSELEENIEAICVNGGSECIKPNVTIEISFLD